MTQDHKNEMSEVMPDVIHAWKPHILYGEYTASSTKTKAPAVEYIRKDLVPAGDALKQADKAAALDALEKLMEAHVPKNIFGTPHLPARAYEPGSFPEYEIIGDFISRAALQEDNSDLVEALENVLSCVDEPVPTGTDEAGYPEYASDEDHSRAALFYRSRELLAKHRKSQP